jgi:hypothetical protein
MKNLLIISLIFTSIFVSCEEDEPEDVVPNIYYGSLTCNIDSLNENYILDIKNTRIDTGINSGTKFITIEGMDLGSNTLRIGIPGREIGVYNVGTTIASICRYTTKQGIVYIGKTGVVQVTKADYINKKLSGTFTLKLLRTGYQDTIYVRNGVFEDLPLPKKQ